MEFQGGMNLGHLGQEIEFGVVVQNALDKKPTQSNYQSCSSPEKRTAGSSI